MSADEAWESAGRAWRRLAVRRGRVVGDDDGLGALSDIGVLRRALEQAELAAVAAARRHGRSWAEIAAHRGVRRQSAWERWHALDEAPRCGGRPDSRDRAVG